MIVTNHHVNAILQRWQNSNRKLMKAREKILIALSGGVDSAVSAALLKKQGFAVFGAHFCFFDGASAKKSSNKAKKIATALNIPLEIIDARKEFKKKIIDQFIASYEKGITPNPCVLCNREMKFALLFDLLKKYKTDFVATGHYARAKPVIARSEATWQSRAMQSGSGLLRSARNDKYKLLEARDKAKDQSYFLYRLTQKELSKIIFPLGELKKAEVKKMAKKFKLPAFENEESQDICFLVDQDINQFLRKNIKPRAGNIVDETGNILAKHQGLPLYTIGQRKGIEIGGTGPYFVIGKNLKKNELIVSNDPKKLLVKKFAVSEASWVHPHTKKGLGEIFDVGVKIQIRYHTPKISAKISLGKAGRLNVETKKPLRAVTPGQSAVFFRKKEVLGGGIII
jgi:tRNA-uridine 2-sulfurtransferase